jgi:adenylate cyclase
MKRLWIGLMTAFIGCVAIYSPFGERLEQNLGLATLYKLRGKVSPPAQVAFVYLDRKTVAQLDLPDELKFWPRSVHACVLKKLKAAGAVVAVFDIAFLSPQPDLVHKESICPEIAAGTNGDQAFIDAIRDFDEVVLLERTRQKVFASDSIAVPAIETSLPFPPLAEAARATAPYTLPRKEPRVDYFWTYLCRHNRLTEEELCRDEFASLPVLALQSYYSTITTSDAAQNQKLSKIESADHKTMLNLYGPPRTVPCRSYQSLLKPELNEPECNNDDFAGKVVFIGAAEYNDSDQLDNFHTVYSKKDGTELEGVEILASAFANLLTDSSLRHIETTYKILVLVIFGLALGIIVCTLAPLSAIVVSILAICVYLMLAHIAFSHYYLVLPMLTPVLIQAPLAILTGSLLHYSSERIRRKKLRQTAGLYIPENALDRLLATENISPSTDLVYGVCLTTDAEDYTSLAERLDPQELADVMNRYYMAITLAVKNHKGQVLDFAGDGGMSAWASKDRESDVCSQACAAAIDIGKALDDLVQRSPNIPTRTRIGLHAGWFALGSVGGAGHLAYKAIGDIANTSARIEQLNKQLDTRILASEEALENVNKTLLRPCGLFKLKGKSEAIRIIEILGEGKELDDKLIQLAEMFTSALELFEEKNWPEAARLFGEVNARFPLDGPTKFYLKISTQYAASPKAAEQDPIIIMQTK